MDEIPTAVVNKLPAGLDQGFVVLNRPYGFLQWVRRYLPHIKEAYVLMIEPDYIFIRPPPLLATATQSSAYHFTYMLPEQNRDIIQPYNEKGVPFKTILPIGAPLDLPFAIPLVCTISVALLNMQGRDAWLPATLGTLCRECARHDSQE